MRRATAGRSLRHPRLGVTWCRKRLSCDASVPFAPTTRSGGRTLTVTVLPSTPLTLWLIRPSFSRSRSTAVTPAMASAVLIGASPRGARGTRRATRAPRTRRLAPRTRRLLHGGELDAADGDVHLRDRLGGVRRRACRAARARIARPCAGRRRPGRRKQRFRMCRALLQRGRVCRRCAARLLGIARERYRRDRERAVEQRRRRRMHASDGRNRGGRFVEALCPTRVAGPCIRRGPYRRDRGRHLARAERDVRRCRGRCTQRGCGRCHRRCGRFDRLRVRHARCTVGVSGWCVPSDDRPDFRRAAARTHCQPVQQPAHPAHNSR